MERWRLRAARRIAETRHVALDLLGITHRQFGRHTPREIEEQIAAAKRREARRYDVAAWQVLQSLAKHKEGQFSLAGLLGRPPLALDPREAPLEAEGPTRAEMDAFEQAGIQGGVMTEAEIEEAYAELTPAGYRYPGGGR